jgi:hypothetical protein
MTVPKGNHFRSGGVGDGAGEGSGVLAFAAAIPLEIRVRGSRISTMWRL